MASEQTLTLMTIVIAIIVIIITVLIKGFNTVY